jgi:hypothetical protein
MKPFAAHLSPKPAARGALKPAQEDAVSAMLPKPSLRVGQSKIERLDTR